MPLELEEENIQVQYETKASQLRRFFSLDSATSFFKYPNYIETDQNDRFEESVCGYDFGLKLAELSVGIVSIGMYSTAVLIVPCDNIRRRTGVLESRMTSLMFPNIVFSSFLIITSVIALSYALKQIISKAIVRTFNGIGAVLYFVSACVSLHVWYNYLDRKIEDDDFVPYVMFCSQIVTSFFNSILYSVDIAVSLRRAWDVK